MVEPKRLERVVGFLRKYAPVLREQGLTFDIDISKEFIKDVESISGSDYNFLSFKREKIYYSESLKHLIDEKVSVSVDVDCLQRNNLNIYLDWSSLLKKVKNRIKVPKTFFVISDGVFYPEDSDDHRIKHYLDITKFIDILFDNCDYQSSENRLVFLHKSNIEFEIDYGAEAVEAGLDGISVLLDMFRGEEHVGQKASLLKETLHGMLVSVNEKSRFTFLLENFGAFSTQLTQSYHLFVSEFSFDDVRREYEEKTREYVTEINKIFSDVQTRMLGVPAILALAAFRFSTISQPEQFFPNLIIFVAVCIYLYMMFYLIRSQEDTLQALRREIKSQMKRFRRDYQKEGRLLRIFEDKLEDRCDNQRKALRKFYWIMGVLFFLTAILFGASLYQFITNDNSILVEADSVLSSQEEKPTTQDSILAPVERDATPAVRTPLD